MPDGSTIRWEPERRPASRGWTMPAIPVAMLRGAAGRCPGCARARLFAGFLRLRPECPFCHAPLGLVRADDAPPYIVILIVAHVVITALVLVDRLLTPSLMLEAAIFLPVTVLLAGGLLRPVKGAIVGLLLCLGLAGEDTPTA